MMTFRPKAGAPVDRAWYAPHRDLAHCGRTLVQRALDACAGELRPPQLDKLRALLKVSDEGLCVAADALGRFLALVPQSAEYPDLMAALDAAGLMQAEKGADGPALALLYAAMGRQLTRLLFLCLRDAKPAADTSAEPLGEDLGAWIDEAEAWGRLRGWQRLAARWLPASWVRAWARRQAPQARKRRQAAVRLWQPPADGEKAAPREEPPHGS